MLSGLYYCFIKAGYGVVKILQYIIRRLELTMIIRQEEDAGYISDFHTDTDDIVTINTYKSYLAIYKREKVSVVSSNPNNFVITPFADKGAYSKDTIVNVDNKQFFLSNGIYSLEQVGELIKSDLVQKFPKT